MKIILRKDVENLGKIGDVLNVKNGYARNYLIPNDFAFAAKESAIKRIELEKFKRTNQIDKLKADAIELADKISNLELSIQMKVGEENKLYGSVTNQIIASKISEIGFDIDKNHILLEEPIKALGVFEVKVKLHSEVSTSIKVWVIAEEDKVE